MGELIFGNDGQSGQMRCVAIDDEPFALRLLEDDIAKIPFLTLVATFTSATDATAFLEPEHIDLLLLDIQMPGGLGTHFLRKLENAPLVIFTTAYDQYALEGFELSVVDYLIKPVSFERLLKAANKAYVQFKVKNALRGLTGENFFFVFSEYKQIRISYNEVLYVEGLKDYVKIFTTTHAHPILTRMNLKAIESKLIAHSFCRIHNSFIVALAKIDSSQKSQVFIGKRAIPVGEKYAGDFWRKYKPA